MKLLDNMKIGPKMIGSFTVIAILLIGVALVGFLNMKNIDNGMTMMYSDRLLPIEQLGQADSTFYKLRGDMYKFILIPEERASVEPEITAQIAEVERNMSLYRASSLTQNEKDELARFETAWSAYQKELPKILALAKTAKIEEVIPRLADGQAISTTRLAVSASLDKLISINVNVADQLNKDGDATFASATLAMGLLSAFALILAAAIGFALTHSIASPLAAIIRVAQQVSAGDATINIPVDQRQDEIGTLAQSFRKMLENLRRSTMDVSEGKRLEEELRTSSFYARNLIEASLDPLVTISPDGKITDVNKSTEQVTGVSREQLIGRDFADYFTEPDKAKAGYQQVFSQGIVKDYPLTIRHSSGRTIDVLYNASIYKNQAGEVQGVFAAARDITERKLKDEELRTSSLYARNLIEASLDPLVTISPEGKITDVNKSTEQVTGVSREQLIGRDFVDYFTEPDKAKAGYQQVFSQGIVKDYPLTIRHSSGRTIDVLYNASIYKNQAGEVQGVFAAARDITERKLKDEELRAYREQLEEKVRQRTSALTDVLTDVKETVGVLTSSAGEILATTTQVASSTSETATSINETTTTVEEVRQAAQLSSQKAQYVSDNAQRVVQASQSGKKAVDETTAGMDRIRVQMESIAQTVVRLSEQSQSIGGIIASVTDLADQSNLLAVNAAIEAARAGEQGKGFGVVAQEIKSLAEQSRQATAQVRGILNDVQKATSNAVMATEQGSKAVEAGVIQAAQAGEAIRVLAETSGEAVQAAKQIVVSSQQQLVGMDQIGVAMENINQAGAQNAASMRQMEVSAQNLHGLGQKFRELVEQFKV